MTWVTNDSAAAKLLRTADRRYEAAKRAASGLQLADKVAALRRAKEQREMDYEAAAQGVKP